MIVSVIGESIATPLNEKYAYEVGKLLAKSNLTLACGGLGGVMEAASEGCKKRGWDYNRNITRIKSFRI